MTEKALLAQLRAGQTDGAAFASDAQDAKALARTICALLNSQAGGVIYCGIAADGTVVGLHPSAEEVRALELNLKSAVTPTALFSVSIDEIGETRIITIDVPAGKDRPYVCDGAVWVREKSITRAADAVALRAMFEAHRHETERWERRASPSMRQEDLDEPLIKAMAEEARRQGRYNFKADASTTDILTVLSLVRPEGFTQAADVLFAFKPAARHPQCRVQLVRFAGDKTDDEFEDYRWFEGPLPKVAEDVVEVLAAFNPVRARFRAGAAQREDRHAYARFAIKEGIVNALVHRDYESYSGGVKVSVYPARIEIWNTGHLPDGIRPSDLAKRHASLPTNPDIAHVFYLRGLMERTGRGGEKIAAACKEIGAPPPKWLDEPSGVTLTLFAALSAGDVVESHLNERQQAFVDGTTPGDRLTLSEYQERYASEVTERQARRDLSELEGYRLVIREGAGRATVYRRLET